MGSCWAERFVVPWLVCSSGGIGCAQWTGWLANVMVWQPSCGQLFLRLPSMRRRAWMCRSKVQGEVEQPC